MGGGGSNPTDGYVIQDTDEDCDGVDGLRASVILEATGLSYEGDLSWTDLETGYEASRTIVQVEVAIGDGGSITCIPFRHLPGQAPEYARLSYDAASMAMTTEDGRLDESGPAVVWLSETNSEGEFTLEVARAFPSTEVSGELEVPSVLSSDYDDIVLVYSPSETTPLGHVSAAREAPAEVLDGGDVNVGVPLGYFPALPE